MVLDSNLLIIIINYLRQITVIGRAICREKRKGICQIFAISRRSVNDESYLSQLAL